MNSSGRQGREFLLRVAAVSGAVVSLVALAVAASRQPDTRLVRARHDVVSPSGRFVARVDVATDEHGVRTWRPMVLERSGAVVFRSDGVLVERPTPRIVWEDDLDTLWIVSADAGTAFVQEGLRGWTSTTLGSADDHLVPAGVRG